MLLHKALPPDELAACLMLMDQESKNWYLSVITSNHSNHSSHEISEPNADRNTAGSTSSTNSDHSTTRLCPQPNADYHNAGSSAEDAEFQPQVGHADAHTAINWNISQPREIEAAGSSAKEAEFISTKFVDSIAHADSNSIDTRHTTKLNTLESIQQTNLAISAAMEALEPDKMTEMMMTLEPATRDWYLSLLTMQDALAHNCSVLDSGSSKHLQSEVCVTNSENLIPLAGFNGPTQWTEGNGYKPTFMQDSITGAMFKVDFEDVDLMTEGLVSNILSLGKLLRKGWAFHLSENGKECYASTPGGAHRIRVELGIDDILRICHSARSGKDRMPLPAQQGSINAVKQSASDASSKFIYEAFFHRSDKKLTHTLRVTKGYIAARINSKQMHVPRLKPETLGCHISNK